MVDNHHIDITCICIVTFVVDRLGDLSQGTLTSSCFENRCEQKVTYFVAFFTLFQRNVILPRLKPGLIKTIRSSVNCRPSNCDSILSLLLASCLPAAAFQL